MDKRNVKKRMEWWQNNGVVYVITKNASVSRIPNLLLFFLVCFHCASEVFVSVTVAVATLLAG